MTKTAFLIRGLTLNATSADADFAELRAAIEAQGYRVVPVPFTWNNKTISQFVALFIPFYEQEKSAYTIVIGGSFGAMAAFAAAPIIQPDGLILCSLSRLFAEDIADDAARLERLKDWLGEARVADCQTLSATEVAQALNRTAVHTTLLYGELEKETHPGIVTRVQTTAKALHTAAQEVPGAGHQMRQTAYVSGIAKVLSSITPAE